MITINSQLDMTPGAIPVVIHRSQYDSDFSIVFTLFARTGDFTIASGTTARVRGTKKTGTGYSTDATLNTSAKTVTVYGDQQMTVVSGQNIFEIVLMSGTKELCSANFILDVERAALDMDTITDETVARELDNLEQFVEEAESAATRAEQAAASFATDTTLTVSGKPADAKAVGDAIANEDKKALAAFATDIASGSIASFLDGADDIPMKGALVHVDPVQDLHGYDSPWPAGGGVNQWDEDWESGYYNRTTGEKAGDSNTTYLRSKNYIPCAPNTSYYFKSPSVHASNDTYYAVLFYDADKNYISAINSGIGNTVRTTPQNARFMTFYIEVGTSGATYHNDIAINYPATVTTYSPYSNICPITGWTAAKVTRTGKNLFNIQLMNNPYTVFGITFTQNSDGSIHVKGTVSGGVASIYSTYAHFTAHKLKAGHTYTFSAQRFSSMDDGYSQLIYTGDTTGKTYSIVQANADSVTITMTEDATYNGVYINFKRGTYDTTFYPQLELGSTASDYELYHADIYDITFPSEAGTVYGGTLDVTKGELVVDRAMVDPGTLDWENYNVSGTRVFRTQSLANAALQYDGLNIICSNYPTVAASQRKDKSISIGSNSSVWIIDSNYSDASAFKTAMNGVQLVYELATPITYQLTPQEITSLLGENNLWADTGNSDVEYRADTKLYITKKITEAVSALS